jgi:tRNA modification GTPase
MAAAPDNAMTDTIVARATPAGRGGLCVVRISGPGAAAIAQVLLGSKPAARQAVLRDFRDATGEVIDRGIALFFPGPRSYTGEDVLELHAHGGATVSQMLIDRAVQLGARIARAGEFTERAFLNDKLDLAQAEAVADLIDAGSRTAALAAQRSLRGDFSAAVLALNEQVTELRAFVEAAIDFPDEDIDFLDSDQLRERLDRAQETFAGLESATRQGCLLRDGVHVVIAGLPNAGKSSLLNALAGYDAAIVTPVPGTTRDLVREHLDIDGLPVHIVDTAGLREARDVVEEEGVRRARNELARADHALVVVDAGTAAAADSTALLEALPPALTRTLVRNKIDLTGETPGEDSADGAIVNVSALTKAGLGALRERLKSVAGFHPYGEGLLTARRRHLDSLQKARAAFDAARAQLTQHHAGELMAEELLQVQNALAEITGEFSSDDLLSRIFGSFCIGK